MKAQFTFTNDAIPHFAHETWENWLSDKVPKDVAKFIFDMPFTIVAMAVAGVAATILFPMFSTPCLGIVSGVVLSRLAIKIIDKKDLALLVDAKDKAVKLNRDYPNLMTAGFIFSAVIGLLSPTLGLSAAIGIGMIKGVVIEEDIYNNNRKCRREKNHSSHSV